MPLPASRGATSSRALPRSQEACVRALPADFIDHLLRAEQTFSRPVSLLCYFQESSVVGLYYFCNSHVIHLVIFFFIIMMIMIIIVTIAGIFFPAQSWVLFISHNSCDGAPAAHFRASVAGPSLYNHYQQLVAIKL